MADLLTRALRLDVESIGNVKDSLTGKEGDGVTITINGKRRSFIWKSLRQFLQMELADQIDEPKPKTEKIPEAPRVANAAPERTTAARGEGVGQSPVAIATGNGPTK